MISNKLYYIIKLCFTPFSIFSPIPFFCLMLFLIANKFTDLSLDNLFLLIFAIFASLISSGASNFWNHTNDIEEDIKNHKKTFLTEKLISQNEAVIISLFLYLISILLVIYLSILLKRPIYFYFMIWAIITWWYSDDIFLKRITGIRLKTHYMGELLTYCIAYPSYTMSIWLILSGSIKTGLFLALIFLCFGISVVFLKDLKDIKGDRDAGLKTFGVIFSPSKLIKFACIFLIFYYIMIIVATNIRIFDFTSFIIILPLLYLLKNTYLPFRRKNWTLEAGDHQSIKAMMYSTYSSIVILGFVNFI